MVKLYCIGRKPLSYYKALRNNIYELFVEPNFALGQKAHLITSEEGNVLWDCLPLLEATSASILKKLGGLEAIAISHPHYYGIMSEWASFFNCPVYIHSNDKEWVLDSSDNITFWEGDRLRLSSHLTLIKTGGHFPGSTILHYESDNDLGALFCGDTLYLSRDRKHISAMYSYPNVIPLAPEKLLTILETVSALNFDSLYGAFEWQNLHIGAKLVISHSLARYKELYEYNISC